MVSASLNKREGKHTVNTWLSGQLFFSPPNSVHTQVTAETSLEGEVHLHTPSRGDLLLQNGSVCTAQKFKRI